MEQRLCWSIVVIVAVFDLDFAIALIWGKRSKQFKNTGEIIFKSGEIRMR